MLGTSLMMSSYVMLSPHEDMGLLPFAHADKLIHAITFLILAFLADAGWPKAPFNTRKYLPLFAYGIAIECLQYFVPTRTFSLWDMLANGAGLFVYGTVFFRLLKKYNIR